MKQRTKKIDIKKNLSYIKKFKNPKWPGQKKIVKSASLSTDQTLKIINRQKLVLDQKFVDYKTDSRFSRTEEKWSFFKALYTSLKDVFAIILIAIIIYNFVMFAITGGIADLAGGILVLILIGLSTSFQIFNSYQIFKKNKAIRLEQDEQIKVLRNQPDIKTTEDFLAVIDEMKYEVKKTHVSKVIKGDVVYFKRGDIVPVDCKIIHTNELFVSQEPVTGDNTVIEKFVDNVSESKKPFELSNILYRGTIIKRGEVWALTLYTQDQTLFEYNKKVEVDEKPDTTFNKQIKKVSKILLTTIAVFVPIIFVISAVLRAMTGHGEFSDANVWMQGLIFAMAIAVALAPDALPLILTSAFSKTRNTLNKNKIVSRDTSVAQNIGSMDVLAIDFEQIFLKKEKVLKSITDLEGNVVNRILEKGILCTQNDIVLDEHTMDLLRQHAEFKKHEDAINKRFKFVSNFENQLYNIKTSIFEDAEGQKYSIIRGNKLDILEKCSTYETVNGNENLNKTNLEKIEETFSELTSKGIESIGIAIKPIDNDNSRTVAAKNYIYLGLINYTLKTKAKSKDVIKDIKAENVDVKFFTKSSLDDAAAISNILQFNIYDPIGGDEIAQMSDLQLSRSLGKTNMFYNVDSAAEVRLIKAYQSLGHTVGFLGKDIEDSIQLLSADIGITTNGSDAFGKNCSNLLIRENGIADIAIAIRESRKSLMNLMKFIKLKITGALSLTFKLLIGLFLINEEPMSALQLLMQNLLFNTIMFAFIYDSIDESYIKEPVRWRTETIIPFALWNGLVFQLFSIFNILMISFVTHPEIISHIRDGAIDTSFEEGSGELLVFQTMYWLEDTITNILFAFVMRTHYKSVFKASIAKPVLIVFSAVAVLAFVLPLLPGTEIALDLSHSQLDGRWVWEWYVYIIGAWTAIFFTQEYWKRAYVKVFKNWL
ncbi:cation transporting ATPase C-terminal domain-containing protein [[Acholeplasma] multilocale]|uniref:P-type ATPase n=1 Tax=[Acholeplasma] multilocale TaxID=264638 RepID=UPI00047A8529|nr:cation transporting ATPase C-terminal domain-containing protein [[Acholeplasma] multilocale]